MNDDNDWYLTPMQFARIYVRVLEGYVADTLNLEKKYHPEDMTAHVNAVAPIVALTIEAIGKHGL